MPTSKNKPMVFTAEVAAPMPSGPMGNAFFKHDHADYAWEAQEGETDDQCLFAKLARERDTPVVHDFLSGTVQILVVRALYGSSLSCLALQSRAQQQGSSSSMCPHPGLQCTVFVRVLSQARHRTHHFF